jgi:RHS repeat-associated protein
MMKTIRILIQISGLLLATIFHSAAQPVAETGWFKTVNRTITNLPPTAPEKTGETLQPQAQVFTLLSQSGVPNQPIAEVITPEIQALADGLQNDPLRIYNYVHDHIRYVLYFGSKKGAILTLLEKSGNDFDQCALLVALLRAAGFTNTQGSNRGVGYQFGWEGLPYQTGNHADLRHWLGLTLTNNNWVATSNYLIDLFLNRGYPCYYFVPGDQNQFVFQRVWVTLTLGSTNYYLDPAFKVSEPIAGMDLGGAMGFSSNALMTMAAGTVNGNYVSNLSEVSIRGTLTGYTTNLLNYILSNAPNAGVQQILGGQYIVPSTNASLPTSLMFPTYVWDQPGVAEMPIVNWNNEPTNLMSSMTITFSSFSYQWRMPQFQGQRLALAFWTNSVGNQCAQLSQDDTWLAGGATSGHDTSHVVISINHPFGDWDFLNNTLIDGDYCDKTNINVYQETPYLGATNYYVILYAFEPDWGWLQKRQNKLAAYRLQGLPDASPQVVEETLNVMGLNWMMQTAAAENLLAWQLGILPQWHNRVGRMAQEYGNGYYVDVYMQMSGEAPKAGWDAANVDRQNRHFDLFAYFGSALEHGLIEQLQSSNLMAASTVKMLQVASTNKQAVYLANSANWNTGATIKTNLVNYDSGTLSVLDGLIANNFCVLLPQNGSNRVASAARWAGYGYVAHYSQNGDATMQMKITGGYHGGYSGDATTADSSYVQTFGDVQPQQSTAAQTGTPNPPIGDPVDTVDGTFQVEHNDLSFGKTEPNGATFSCYYNSARRFSNPAGMAPGWINNYYLSATEVAAPQAGLGGTTPAQMAPMLAATCAAVGSYNAAQPNPKNWLVTALIAKWGVDQLTKNGVSVVLGKDTLQFVKQPNGVFTPPANCTMTLTASLGTYDLAERRGRTFANFDAAGPAYIYDPYHDTPAHAMNLTYNSSNWTSLAIDSRGRTLTLNYSISSPKRLLSVSDGTRTVTYQYSFPNNSRSDLIGVIDSDGYTNTYVYDTNHQIAATYNALKQLVVSNVYDSQGHVTTQYTRGDTNQMWRVFWSGWQTVEQDPAGNQRTFCYDDQSRLVAVRDQLGNLTQTVYDGQNHVVMTVSPLGETNRYIYDDRHNVTNAIDPLGFTSRFFYDNQNNLVKMVDARGNPSTFGYNAEFSLTGQTNGAGDWVNYTYNSADGTLHTRSDAGGTTTYGYDGTYGQLIRITYPGGLGTNGFANNAFGDVTSHTNARGFKTSYQYNQRRQLTNTIAPTNLTVKAAYDAVGNVASTTDARGNVSSNIWSATRHLLATKLPATPQGTAVVTNIYDNCDRLIRTLDPLQNPTRYTNDAAGRLISLTDPLQRTTTFGFDADGRQIAATNAALEVTSQTWDKRGQLLQLTDGAGHVSSRAYDAGGNQIILTNRNGKKWQFQFDGANRLTNTITPLNQQTSMTFDNRGLLKTVREPSGQMTTNYYDAKARLTNVADSISARLYGYDAADNLTNLSETLNSQPSTLNYTFDAYNRLSSFKDAPGNVIQYRYDASGNLTNLIYPGGKNVYYAFDSLNRLTNVTDWAGRKTGIGYDLAGRMTSLTRPNGTCRTINYDVAGQATNIWEQMANGLPIAWFRFNWNASATMQWEFAAPLPHTNNVPTRTMTYDSDNRLATVNGLSVTVDADGNLVNGPLTNDTFSSYAFDARNRLLNVGGVTNAYDAMNNRVGQTCGTNTTVFVVNPNAKLPQVLMRIKNGVTNYYVYGAGLLYEVTETATATNARTYHYDYRGSTVALTDESGNVTDRAEYSAYGTLTYRSGNTDTPFLFNGRYGVMTDPNGLLYMRARYYNPYLCRFLNPDPSGFKGGLNFYAAFNGNPVSYRDPSGLGAVGDNQYLSWLTGASATPVSLQDPFGVAFSGERLSVEQQMVNAMQLVAVGMDCNPNVYQLSEPTTTALVLGLGGLLIGQPELGELGTATGAGTMIAARGGTTVYSAVENGVTRYVGITDNLTARAAAQLRDKGIVINGIDGLTGLARADARAVEQVLIEANGLGKNGGTLLNKINSISPNNSIYQQSIQRGNELLRQAGYSGF